MASSRRVEPLLSNSMEETPSHFFKVILPETLSDKKLRIPDMFVRKFGYELSAFATLTAPNGRVWQNSNFHILVFDLSACEINYTYSPEQPEHEQNSIHQDEMESEDSAECCNCATSVEKSLKFKDGCEMQRKRCRVEEPEEKNESNAVDESWIGKLNCIEMYNSQGSLRCKRNLDGNSKNSCARSPLAHHKDLKIDRTKSEATADNNEEDEHPTVDQLELMAALEDAGISFTGRFRSLAEEERERALNVARLFKPEKPSFMVILRSCHTNSIRNHLFVPAKFANKYLTRDVHVKFIKLQTSDGREWPVQIIWKHNGVSLRKGWAEFSSNKKMKEGDICVFELVRMEDILLKVSRIPEKFAMIFGDELSNAATLTIPNGRVWQVGLTKDGRKIWFQDGWHDFIQYPDNGKEPENDNPNSLHQDESENEDSVEIMDFTTPYSTFDSPKNIVFDKCPWPSSIMPSQLNPAKTSFGSAFGSSKFKHGYGSQNKRLKMEELVESSKSNAIDIDIKLKKTAYKVGTHATDEATKSDEDELMALLEDMGIFVNKRFRNIAVEERERAIAAARLFKPKNPSFMVILRSVDIRLCRLYVPAKFAHRYFNRNTKNIKVLDPEGRKWSVQLSWMPLCFITKLGGFAKELDDGDICIFELIKRNKLKALVLRSVKDESN
ncbi:hypothetical protein JRO89_XS02G0056600 [Xanthoceras sorbifolium]|uniref:TF-B3 domain-containing protein n=1 Tax=Xanthoceras sorbifolium TaxID=99658 RepID=A0ABQ8IES5_9ROSI|nr:hypothetical protein JRO89_XS02G0056600 [Xanthoceras sorbifolium]